MARTEISKAQPQTPAARPLDVFSAMRNEMDRLFDSFERGWPRWPSLLPRGNGEALFPDIDIHENGQRIMIEADLPGVDEKDVSVTFANGMLTIKGEKKSAREETKENYYMAERSYGAFERSLRLPDTIDEDKIEARFEKGVLKVIAPKKPEAVKAEKKIEVKKG
jgi:HSP20 family protein